MKNLLSIYDLSAQEIWAIVSAAARLKSGRKKTAHLNGKSLGLIFEKPSTRTSVSFSVAMYELGGFPLMLDARNLQRKRGESIYDTAQTLSRYLHGVVIRAFNHSDVEEFASAAGIPVINGLTDREHPCQILGDILTIVENKKIKTPAALKKIKVAFVGDGNNVSHSLMASAAVMGFSFAMASPRGYEPDLRIIAKAREYAARSGAKIDVMVSPQEAVRGADVIYTDVWTSMGAESEQEKRKKIFKPYQVNRKLLELAKPACIVMHCLPANRGEEATAEVLDGPHSVIFDQAENRLHIQKAILIHLIKK
ncbi:MAG: ornithine carbamoyltransferase [Elusimicrobia bacterium RIFOXYB2_FULL_49_7]|nr:MAG: ornithine carbamoyltransferase [Elusimicrobia bacterium RIFOXYB2_FULL_49_7]